MRIGFIAAAGPAQERNELGRRLLASPLALKEVGLGAALTIWTTAQTPLLTDRACRSVLIGRMFERGGSGDVLHLPSELVPGPRLLRDYWGPYVLLTLSNDGHQLFRDPSGAVPVYYGREGGLDLYASAEELLALAWRKSFEPDLDAAREWLAFPFLRTGRTGVAGISELAPGAASIVRSGRTMVRQMWQPADFLPARDDRTVEEAATELRKVILATVAAVASRQSPITLRLSGGLDSSIVAAALAQAQAPFGAITFATRSRDGDERRFAQAIADRCGCELTIVHEGDEHPRLDGWRSRLQRPPNPMLQPLRKSFAAAITETNAALSLDGAGGDNIFAALTTASPVLDALCRRGWGAALTTVRDLAELHDCSPWEVGRKAFRRALRGRRARWPRDHSFLNPDAVPSTPPVHPWLSGAGGLRAADQERLRMIAGIHHFLPEAEPVQPLSLHPLLMQPIVEATLNIPVWMWFTGGRDRAIARIAFRGLVPDSILDRRSKGSLQSLFSRGFRALRPSLGGFLVHGRLADAGLIDRMSIAAYLEDSSVAYDRRATRILELASAEQWLRSFDTG